MSIGPFGDQFRELLPKQRLTVFIIEMRNERHILVVFVCYAFSLFFVFCLNISEQAQRHRCQE